MKKLDGQPWKMGIMAGVLAIIVFLLGSNYYIGRIRQTLWHQAVTDALEITRQSTHALSVYIESCHFLLAERAKNFTENSSGDIPAIGRKLDFYEHGNPSFSVIDLAHGKIYFNSRASADLTEKELAAYQAMPARGVLTPYIDDYTGQRMFGCYEKFTFADGVQGLVRKGHPLAEISDDFSLSFFNDTGFSYVVDADGFIMMRPNKPNSNRTFKNVFDVVEVAGNSAEEIALFREGMSGGRRGAIRLMSNSEDCVFTFVPVQGTAGWYVVSIIPSSSIMAHADNLIQAAQMVVGIAGIAVITFIIFGSASKLHSSRAATDEEGTNYREHIYSVLAKRTDQVFIMLEGDALTPVYVSPNVERVLGVRRQSVMDDITALPAITCSDGQPIGQEELRAVPAGEMKANEGSFTHKDTGEIRRVEVRICRDIINGVETLIIALADKTAEKI